MDQPRITPFTDVSVIKKRKMNQYTDWRYDRIGKDLIRRIALVPRRQVASIRISSA